MALKRIKITEAQAFDLLLEAASLGDVYQKYYNQIPEEEFRQIVSADPTSGEDKMGKYSKWLLALYTGGNLKLEDLYKATQYLTIFHKYKQKLQRKDIGQYKSLPDLYVEIKPYEDNTQAASHNEEIRQMKEGAEKVYEDAMWLIVVPHTKDAAIFYGKGTQWCTAATGSDNYFDYYNEQGPLYININKHTGRKYQFHFETQSFKNEQDYDIYGSISETIGLSEGAIKYYYSVIGNDVIYLTFSGEIWKVNNSHDLYVTHGGSTLQQMVNGVPQELAYSEEEYFDEFLICGRYINLKKRDGSNVIVNIFDIKEKDYVFEPDQIRNILNVDHNERYVKVTQAYSGKKRLFDLKTKEWLDTFSQGLNNAVSLNRYVSGMGHYPDNLVAIWPTEGKRECCAADLSKDKQLTDVYAGVVVHYLYYRGMPFKFAFFTNTLDNECSDGTVVLFYDGTVIPYREFNLNHGKYFEKFISERNISFRQFYLCDYDY